MTPTVALTIAGSDSGGGAGLQADLRTFAAWGVHGTCAVTAVTAENTTAVRDVRAIEPELVVAQIAAVRDDLAVGGVKSGMLATPATVAALGELAARADFPPLVVDPVLVSSTGSPLMAEGGVRAYRELLLPHATVATPNLREAALLTGRGRDELTTVEAMEEVALELRALGVATVVVKGGHLAAAAGSAGVDSPDVVAGPRGVRVLPAARVETGNDHGTGCSLSAAIAANLALGSDPLEAVLAAKAFVHRALEGAARWRLGAGHGPIDHLGWSTGGIPPVAAGRAATRAHRP